MAVCSGGKSDRSPGPVELVETLGGREILQLVLPEVAYPEVAKRLVADGEPGRLRDEHLTSVAGRADPRAAMDVEADI